MKNSFFTLGDSEAKASSVAVEFAIGSNDGDDDDGQNSRSDGGSIEYDTGDDDHGTIQRRRNRKSVGMSALNRRRRKMKKDLHMDKGSVPPS